MVIWGCIRQKLYAQCISQFWLLPSHSVDQELCVWGFFWAHIYHIQTVKVLARPHICTVLPEPSLFLCTFLYVMVPFCCSSSCIIIQNTAEGPFKILFCMNHLKKSFLVSGSPLNKYHIIIYWFVLDEGVCHKRSLFVTFPDIVDIYQNSLLKKKEWTWNLSKYKAIEDLKHEIETCNDMMYRVCIEQ